MATLREIQWVLKEKLEELNQRDLWIDELEEELLNRENVIHSLKRELNRYRGIISKLTSVNNALRKSAASKPGSSSDVATAPVIRAYDSNYTGSTKPKKSVGIEHTNVANDKSLLSNRHKAAEVILAAIAVQNDPDSIKLVDDHHHSANTFANPLSSPSVPTTHATEEVKNTISIDMTAVGERSQSTWSDLNIEKMIDFTSKYSFKFKVYVQGSQTGGKVAFLTVHDVGSNHVPFCDFVSNEYMTHVAENSVWYHICLPGQDQFDEELSENTLFPTLDAIASELSSILDHIGIQAVIGFGEGAGANILLRFGLLYPNKCFGLVLINCTASSPGVDERLQSTLLHFLEGGKKFAGKFRHMLTTPGNVNSLPVVKMKEGGVDNVFNLKNVEKYAESFGQRSDISKFLDADLNVDCLVITGRLSPFKATCEEMMTYMNKIHTTLLVVDDASDVLYESQKDSVRSLILFCKGCGVLIGVPMVGLEKEFNRIKKQQRSEEKCQTDAQKELLHQIKIYESLLYDSQ